MAIINQGLVDSANIAARAVHLVAQQSIASTVSSAINSATSSPIPTSTSATYFSTGGSLSTTSPDPTPTSTGNNGNNGNNNSGTSSPLLFFVALGFGVVFTNLWIIVGVKYCFRYNARNRQMRGLDENGEPINLENMPTRPHRRRREKKLMTMDEVNDKFPMMKYKSWAADRAKEGLPTTGGVSVPPSRANSVRSVQGIVPELPSKERESSVTPQFKTEAASPHGTSGSGDNDTTLTHAQTEASILTKDPDRAHGSDDEEDDEHINAALPPELMATSGDTCAICIDTLEDDDDVRGLTCGHAFHAVCLDPWLTNRRACCPLCKADYYTPKPRPPPADADPLNPASSNAPNPGRNNGRLNMPRSPQRTFTGWNLRGTVRTATGQQMASSAPAHSRAPRIWERRRHEAAPSHNQATPTTAAQDEQDQGLLTRLRSRIPPLRVNDLMDRSRGNASNGTQQPLASGANHATTTPSQLEAGTGSSATPAR
ncbi:uncharacterized protein BCR38DRAFT_414939 [Pseudomassariella vexata]|uniref:RING-type domain-containing protein n=1 Tax=Pseudomassariella vexata TaxID=1141098 RepID=A0A1Y2D8A4_9PEZI|nr:uncharacterized protein BCR38DRAFT_414939 [Pseudomassariella vexata]ORY55492.1 hypothetical protein BCR38DRAFT_414939 [Pseudomassariella vexata]